MSNAVPTITNAAPEDIMAIIAMHSQAWLDTYPNEAAGVSRDWVQARVDSWTDVDKLARHIAKIEHAQNDSDTLYHVAKDEAGRIVGVSRAVRDKETQTVGAVYIDKHYYGTGLAQRFMDKIIAWSDPTRPLELQVATYNERAKAFYRKYGFEQVASSEHLHSDKIPVVTMIRKGDKQ